jgi:hypothetical protein
VNRLSQLNQVREGGLRLLGLSSELRSARSVQRLVKSRPDSQEGGRHRVAILTPRSWAYHANLEALVDAALKFQGAEVFHYVCGGGRRYCDRVHIHEYGPPPCTSCTLLNRNTLRAYGIKPLAIGGDVDPGQLSLFDIGLDELLEFEHEGVPIGRLVSTSLRWFLCAEDLEKDPLASGFLRQAITEGLTFAEQFKKQLLADRPDALLLLNGQFFFERIATYCAEQLGISVVTYERGYDKGSVFVSEGIPASRYDTSARWASVSERILNNQQNARLDVYLEDRMFGRRSIANFWPDPTFDVRRDNYSLLLTNVVWDTAAQNRGACFPDQRSWLKEVVRWYGENPKHRLVIRVHPAEVRVDRARSREGAADIVRSVKGMPFANIEIIEADDSRSSYPLMDGAGLVHVFASTAGLEAAIRGKAVLVAGDAQYAFKGFTFEPSDAEDYLSTTVRFLALTPEVEVARARNFAHFFFFEAQVRLDDIIAEPRAGLVRLGRPRDFVRSVETGGLRAFLDALIKR